MEGIRNLVIKFFTIISPLYNTPLEVIVYTIRIGHDGILLCCNLHSLPGFQQLIAEKCT